MANYKNKLLQRRHKDEEDTAYAFQEFIQTFQNATPMPKTFIKSELYNPGCNKNEEAEDKGRLYTPVLHMPPNHQQDTKKKAIECARLLKVERTTGKCSNQRKPKSNLEQLKEELQLRHQHVDRITSTLGIAPTSNVRIKKESSVDSDCLENTTNLFLTSLNPKLNEQDLMQIFGVYGPLASVKIMWPRVSERNRSSNIGFVGFMSRKDSERAFYSLGNRQDMRVSWGKPIEIPSQPIYIPPELLKTMLPPPYSGLPFNAQMQQRQHKHNNSFNGEINLENTVVKVTIPMDKRVLSVIHRTIEFVIREGPLFEAMIMNKEINNVMYSFLFDNKTADHVYYRWKLFSIMNGESPNNWSTKPFRMFETGSIWIPPTIPDYTKGMPVKTAAESKIIRLSDVEQSKLIELIQYLTPNRLKIADVMLFCLDKLAAAKDIVNIIAESFDTQGPRKAIKQIARLYLISDILYNAKFKKISQFANCFEQKLPHIFVLLDGTLQWILSLQEVHFANCIKSKILKVLRAWEIWRLFSNEFIYQLECKISKKDEDLETNNVEPKIEIVEEEKPSETKTAPNIEDIYYSKFIKSKWETVDPLEVEAQAMSTQRMYDMEMERQNEINKQKLKIDQLSYEQLRKVEMKVIRYQDDLEVGKRRLKYGKTIDDDVKEYRKRCIDKFKLRSKKRK